jgi:hypothetical protein
MTNLTISCHEQQGMAQRCINQDDMDLAVRFGTMTADGILMDRRAVTFAMQRLKRLENSFIPIADSVAITVQWLEAKKAKRKRRGGSPRN